MRGINNILDKRELIEGIISEYGFSSEHNFWYFYNMMEEGVRLSFFVTAEGYGLPALYYEEEDEWEIASDVLAPEEKRMDVLLDFVVHALKSSNKVFVNLEGDFRKEFAKNLGDKYKVHKPTRVFDSPMYNLEEFDEKLPGKDWKKIRNMTNSFFTNNKVEIKDFDKGDRERIKKIVLDWERTRKSTIAKAWAPVFVNFVDNDFNGCDMARIVYVDGEPCSITAGWRIPNSDTYYSAIGIHNYKYKGLGEAAYIDDLKQSKLRGFSFVDFGGSEKKNLLSFKQKFNPEIIKRQYFFAVSKK